MPCVVLQKRVGVVMNQGCCRGVMVLLVGKAGRVKMCYKGLMGSVLLARHLPSRDQGKCGTRSSSSVKKRIITKVLTVSEGGNGSFLHRAHASQCWAVSL